MNEFLRRAASSLGESPRLDAISPIELLMPGHDRGFFFNYVPSDEDGLTELQRKFALKLKRVINDDDPISQDLNSERHIDDVMCLVMDAVGLNDCVDLLLEPGDLHYKIGRQHVLSQTGRVGRQRQLGFIYLIQQSTHLKTIVPEEGKCQILCTFLAAHYYNFKRLGQVYPETVYGIRTFGEKVFFSKASTSQAYMKEVCAGIPGKKETIDIKLMNHGLSLCDPKERCEVISCLLQIRLQAMKWGSQGLPV